MSDFFVVRKCYDPVVVHHHPHGDDVETDFRLTRDEHFNSHYVSVGERNIVDYINSFATGCSLKAIIERCSLMPVHDKISYLQQRESGFSADLSHMPKDGVEARIMLQRLNAEYPDFAARLNNGESFDSVISSLFSSPSSNSHDNGGDNNGTN